MLRLLSNMFQSIFAKFTLMFILVGLLPIMVMSYMIFEKLPEEVESYMVTSYEESLLYAAKNVELKLQGYDLLTKNIYQYDSVANTTLSEVLRGQDYERLPVYVDEFLEDYLRSLIYSDTYIASAFLLGPDKKVFDYYSKGASYYYEDLEMNSLPEFSRIYVDQRVMTILPTHSEAYFRTAEKELVTFARNCLDLNALPISENIVATLLLEVDVSFIDDIISRMDLVENGTIHIVDRFGYDIYSSNQDSAQTKTIYNNMTFDEDRGHQILDGQYYFYQVVDGSDWVMVFTVDESNLLQLINGFSGATVLILVVVMVALLFMAITFSNNLSKPIRSIINQMKKVSAGDLETKVCVEASYEVNQLAEAFNKMTDQLKRYIDEAYGAQIKQREAELNGLKTQIRPHYLYNTLEIIRMSALEESATVTQEMIESLSEQLKYVIGQYGDRVTLADELAMIENYFKIIKQRYEGRITLDISVPKTYYAYPMLKLLMQPLVENAVVHGLKVKKGKGKVRVSGKMKDDVLTLEVMDDGVGMSEATLAEIEALLNSEKMGKELNGHWEAIGLKNVHDRIQMNYGKAYGLTISSRENLGTKMSIRFPVSKEGEPC